MVNNSLVIDDDHVDDSADEKIKECLNLDTPKSFFLFAGAGSGKTRSLVKALAAVNETSGDILRLRGQQIGVITYTNNACNEIKSRLKYDSLIYVSTIHSFIWDLIKNFNSDIKKWLERTLTSDIADLNGQSSRPGTKTETDRIHKIESKKQRMEDLKTITKFTYSPDAGKTGKDSLNHTEVLQIGAHFLCDKPLMQRILIKKFPILLIDESQDANKLLAEAFLKVQQQHGKKFSLGLLGDTMQRIYGDGKSDLGENLPIDWEKPAKRMNHRSPARIIELINKIRSEVDKQTQQARVDKQGGTIRLFIVPTGTKDKKQIENTIRRNMATITEDDKWVQEGEVTSLILEHHMAASRLGFLDMCESLYQVENFKTGFLDGTLAEIRLFSDIILPLFEAHKNKDKFSITNIVKKYSPLFDKKFIVENKDKATDILKKAKEDTDKLCNAYDIKPTINFFDILKIVHETGLFRIPNRYMPILLRTATEQAAAVDEIDTPTQDEINGLDKFLSGTFSQIQEYSKYIKGQSVFFTHQGVKGLEFPRVMVIIDDDEARGPSFSYDKLFGIKDKTGTDIKNEQNGKETSIDRTRRLFYVICSRAEESLAIVAYTKDQQKLYNNLVANEWFVNEEIIKEDFSV